MSHQSPFDMRCPKCGELIDFTVVTPVPVELGTDGCEPKKNVHIQWDGKDPCFCEECRYKGIVQEFYDAYVEKGEEPEKEK